jgi:hypothetical protein
MSRQQLPPQIKKVTVADRKTGKSVVRYQLTVDTGTNPQTGRRQQARRRCATERAARDALAQIADATARGQFVSRSSMTVDQLCADYLAGRHKLRESSKAKLEYDLAPFGNGTGSYRRSGSLRLTSTPLCLISSQEVLRRLRVGNGNHGQRIP